MDLLGAALTKESPAHTLVELLYAPLAAPEGAGGLPILIEPRGNLVRKYDREELAHLTDHFARGMRTTHSKSGTRIGMICQHSARAIIAAMGNLLNGSVNVIIPAHATPEEQIQALASSRCDALVVDSIEAARPMLQQIKSLPQLRQLVVLAEGEFAKQPEILCTSWKELMERGEKQPDRLAQQRQALVPEQDAFLYFHFDTSKRLTGKLFTHANLLERLEELIDQLPSTKKLPWQRLLAMVPFHHPHSLLASVFLPLAKNYSCMLLEPADSWKLETLAPRRTFLIADPVFFASLAQHLRDRADQQGGWMQQALEKAQKPTEKPLSALTRWGIGQLLGRPLRSITGGRFTGGIAIDSLSSAATEALFCSMGTPVIALPQPPQEMLELRAASA
jgi:acyl-CoA synthetase (AMP-forming)/AMP-acid ligase II